MSPEPDVTSRSTAPETCRVRSKWPVADAHSGRLPRARIMSRRPQLFNGFMLPPIKHVFLYGANHLLQNHLLLFLQAGKQFGLGAVGNAYGYGDLLLAVFAAGIWNLHRGLAVFVVDQRCFGD